MRLGLVVRVEPRWLNTDGFVETEEAQVTAQSVKGLSCKHEDLNPILKNSYQKNKNEQTKKDPGLVV